MSKGDELIIKTDNDKYLHTTSLNNLNYFMNRLNLDKDSAKTKAEKRVVIIAALASLGYDIPNGKSKSIDKIVEFMNSNDRRL
jgi:hypothetical protein